MNNFALNVNALSGSFYALKSLLKTCSSAGKSRLINECDGAKSIVSAMETFPGHLDIQRRGAWNLNEGSDLKILYKKLLDARSFHALYNAFNSLGKDDDKIRKSLLLQLESCAQLSKNKSNLRAYTISLDSSGR
jgi:hypothetical protein